LPRALGQPEFAALLAPLGPFGERPVLAAGVSGGPDSLALALLAHDWAVARGGALLALIVDHRLRADSTNEAQTTARHLADRGIAASILTLQQPPASSAAARAARLAALEGACTQAAIPFLLLAQHRADQAETVLWRGLRGSAALGLAGMPARRETARVAILRPLLGVPPARLRTTCRAAGLQHATDPTNRDPAYARPRLRALLADRDGTGAGIGALAGAAGALGAARAAREQAAAALLGRAASIRPQGFALVDAARLDGADAPLAAAMLLRAMAGAAFLPDPGSALALLRRGHGTLAGLLALPAGRLGRGRTLLVREPAASAPAQPAELPRWDRRWAISGTAGLWVGPLGADRCAGNALPALVRATLPAFRDAHGMVVACPGLGYAADGSFLGLGACFAPAEPAAGASFLPEAGKRGAR
jgi:tRNA(Ile)-lysidine synthase